LTSTIDCCSMSESERVRKDLRQATATGEIACIVYEPEAQQFCLSMSLNGLTDVTILFPQALKSGILQK